MYVKFRSTILIGYLFFIAGSVFAEEPRPTISVSGSAEIRVAPDEVVITASVESRAKTLAAAATDNEAKIAQVLEFLKTADVDSQNIHTEYVGIEPIMRERDSYLTQRQHSPRSSEPANNDIDQELQQLELLLQPLGYKVRRQFRIRLTDLSKFETVYHGLVERGINQVNGIQFNSTDLRKYRDQARVNAVRAAREKATAMAAELDASISSIKSIEETVFGNEAVSNNMQTYSVVVPVNGAFNEDGSFAAGQIHITASVDIVFYLGNTNMED